MSKLLRVPVKVREGDNGPVGFYWRGRLRLVARVLERWLDAGRWWEGETEKEFFRVQVREGGVYELYRDRAGTWVLYRVFD